MTTLLLSQGVPMLLAGDELSHTQQGNNNTYCQDSELTWLDWKLNNEERNFLEFVRQVISIRRTQPVFQRRKFFQGREIFGADVADITWFEPSGKPMREEGWNAGFNQCFGCALAGDLIGDVDGRGQPVVGDSMLILMNAYHETIPFKLPGRSKGEKWQRIIDTANPEGEPYSTTAGKRYELKGRSIVVLRATSPRPKAMENRGVDGDRAGSAQEPAAPDDAVVVSEQRQTT
jgi:glycogen operon protein